MYIAQQLKDKNIAEYLIYMWQVEDLIRAYGLDIDRIKSEVLSRYKADESELKALEHWYADLIVMMREEGVVEKGHLQINNNVLINLTELHHKLLDSAQFPFYSAAYYKALPFIVELRAKNGQRNESELQTCFEALYGVMLLRLQQKSVSPETTKALESISSFLSLLANYNDKDRKGELEFE